MSISTNGGGKPRENGSQGYYPTLPATEEDSGSGLTFGQALGTIRRRWWVVVLSVVVVFGAAWKMVPRDTVTFRATAAIRMQDPVAAVTGSLTGGIANVGQGNPRSQENVLSQMHVIRSRAVIGTAVDREGLRVLPSAEVPDRLLRDVSVQDEQTRATLDLQFAPDGFTVSADGQQASGVYGQPVEIAGVQFTLAQNPGTPEGTLEVVPREMAIDIIGSALNPTQRPRSSIIDINFVDRDPVRARRVANAIADAYIEKNIEQVQEAFRTRTEFIQRQWASAEANRSRAEQALEAFRARTQPYSSSERLRNEQLSLMSLDSQREQLDGERRVLASFLRQVQNAGDGDIEIALRTLLATPGTTSSPLLTDLYTRYAQHQRERDALLARGAAPTHDEVVRLDNLIANVRASVLDAARTQIAALDLRISVMDDQRQRSASTIRSLPQSEESRLTHELDVARGIATTLHSEYQRSLMSEGVESAQVAILDAAAPAAPVVRAGRRQKLSIALFFGILLGSGSATLMEAANTSVRRRKEVETQLAVPGLGVIPRISNGNEPRAADLSFVKRWSGTGRLPVPARQVQQQFNSSAGEAYRKLRTNLVFLRSADQLKTLVVTSASSGEGKTTTAANLAVAFARHGRNVLLVDCDLRRPRLHEIFSTEKSPGFIDLLLGKASGAEAVRPTSTERLSFLPRGEYDERAGEALGTTRMHDLMVAFREHYDLVIFDTSPVLLTADAPAVAALADGVLLVVRAGRTPRAAVRQTQQQLEVVGAEVLGFVLNDPDAIASRYGENDYANEYYAVEA
jgi:capsular exopolysaccharide synthesis family protein